ncbi:LysE family translocator [Kroppenstedtia pulmonis]|uniref:LysE family translocator n=1 Tax=Kroppenstedtia pulmonis TaxID=1380685 RepID=A0A7D4B2G5_9BACL|nr:LysE family translocator [Kroppenstedtia pulmonis]QKG84366.1 LysE family translocator [Kroppenstedtia pulmonis]
MDVMNLFYFAGLSMVLTFMPGPDILFVITQSITGNWKDGMVVAIGLCTGLVVHTMAAALGVSAILHHSSLAFQTLKIAGAVYLFYLAWQALREAGSSHDADGSGRTVGSQSLLGLYQKGILMNLLNPKVSLFFLAFLPQFISPGSTSVHLQMVILGLIFILQAVLVFSVVSLIAHRLGRIFMKNATVSRWVNRGKAGIYVALGAKLFMMDNK